MMNQLKPKLETQYIPNHLILAQNKTKPVSETLTTRN